MTGKPPHILLLEDSDFDAELIEENLSRLRPKPKITRSVRRSDFARALEDGTYDVILSDYSLPDFDGLAALVLASEKAPGTPFIFVSGVLGEEIAIESFRKGATDYVLKQKLIRLPSAVERALAETRERKERLRAERQKELLVRELSHRVKNTMAVVMAIVRRTARTSQSVGEYEQALVSRLQSMSEAHALLFEENWGETEMGKVLRRILDPYRREDSPPFSVSGPVVKLEPKAALALGMVFHELVTNAAKYGSMSVPGGKVEVGWTIGNDRDGERRVLLTWSESGGPAVSEPNEPGFGSVLIERSIRYELDGDVRFAYPPSGFRCECSFPL